MKKIHFKLLIAGLITLTSCLDQELVSPQANSQIISEQSTLPTTRTTQIDTPTIIRNQVVVRYHDENISQSRKDDIKSRYEDLYNFKIDSIETCNCGINDLELWTIDTTLVGFDTIGIEGVVSGLTDDTRKQSKWGSNCYHRYWCRLQFFQ